MIPRMHKKSSLRHSSWKKVSVFFLFHQENVGTQSKPRSASGTNKVFLENFLNIPLSWTMLLTMHNICLSSQCFDYVSLCCFTDEVEDLYTAQTHISIWRCIRIKAFTCVRFSASKTSLCFPVVFYWPFQDSSFDAVFVCASVVSYAVFVLYY